MWVTSCVLNADSGRRINQSLRSSLTSGLVFYGVQLIDERIVFHNVMIGVLSYAHRQQRDVARLEVVDHRRSDVLTLVAVYRQQRRQTPLQFTHAGTITIGRRKQRLDGVAKPAGCRHVDWLKIQDRAITDEVCIILGDWLVLIPFDTKEIISEMEKEEITRLKYKSSDVPKAIRGLL